MRRTESTHRNHKRCVKRRASAEEKLLQWMEKECDLKPKPCGVRVREQGPRGRGLVANRNFAPGETLASMPVHVGIGTTMETNPGLPWTLELACQMLEERAAQRSKAWDRKSWWECLPKENANPVLFAFTEGEVMELQDEDTVQEAQSMREIFEDKAAEVIRMSNRTEWGVEELSWAASMMQSRCFITDGEHWTFPLIDMCNHDFQPNAQVESIRSPDACQGLDALEEVASIDRLGLAADRFALVAGDRGVYAGEEILISYGNWPNDVFLLFFGFIPDDNPHDAVVLFNGAEEVVRWVVGEGRNYNGNAQFVKDTARMLVAEVGDDLQRIVVLRDGVDARIPAVATKMSKLMNYDINVMALVSDRCEWLLQTYMTTLEEDEDLLRCAELSSNEQLAVRYRLGKKKLLQGAISAISGVI